MPSLPEAVAGILAAVPKIGYGVAQDIPSDVSLFVVGQ
jgi:hypothetical protein